MKTHPSWHRLPSYLERASFATVSQPVPAPAYESLKVGDTVTLLDASYHLEIKPEGFKRHTDFYNNARGNPVLLIARDCVLPAPPDFDGTPQKNDCIVSCGGRLFVTCLEYLEKA